MNGVYFSIYGHVRTQSPQKRWRSRYLVQTTAEITPQYKLDALHFCLNEHDCEMLVLSRIRIALKLRGNFVLHKN